MNVYVGVKVEEAASKGESTNFEDIGGVLPVNTALDDFEKMATAHLEEVDNFFRKQNDQRSN